MFNQRWYSPPNSALFLLDTGSQASSLLPSEAFSSLLFAYYFISVMMEIHSSNFDSTCPSPEHWGVVFLWKGCAKHMTAPIFLIRERGEILNWILARKAEISEVRKDRTRKKMSQSQNADWSIKIKKPPISIHIFFQWVTKVLITLLIG